MSEINFVSVHADTWDFGFGIWLDGVHFTNFGVDIDEPAADRIQLHLYPNPANHTLHLECAQSFEFEIYNAVGRMVHSGSGPGNIDLSGLPGGVYYLHSTQDELKSVQKFIKL